MGVHNCSTTSKKFPWKKFCQEIFCPIPFRQKCFSELQNEFFLEIKFILLAGRDCWKYLLNLQLCRAVLSSCPAKNSWEISFCNWSVKLFRYLFSTCLVKIVVVKLSERPDSKVSYRTCFSFLWVLRDWNSPKN